MARALIPIALLAALLAATLPGASQAATLTPASVPQCLRQASPPSPPSGGAVFAGPLEPNSSKPNVVVMPAGSSWQASACAQDAGQVMTHPTSIAVAPDAAALLQDQPAGLVSPWGAKDVQASDPAPVLFPGRSDWTTTAASVVDPEYLLNVFNSCRACSLQGIDFTPAQAILPTIAYERDLSGADMTGATLSGDLSRWDLSSTDLSDAMLSGANLTGATLDHTIVNHTDFDGADLRGASLISLQYQAPPSFGGIRVGPSNGSCTTFKDTDLVNAHLTPEKPDPGCETTPLLPGSAASLAVIDLLVAHDHANVDFANARFVADADNRGKLAGDDLQGIQLNGASFVGFPADLAKTNFDGASLQGTSFELANLSGATFQNVSAAGASFQDARLNAHGNVDGASFAGAKTNLEGADFVAADIRHASFVSADLSGAVFNRALAVGTDFQSVLAKNAGFSGAHVYGDGQAFDNARDLQGADFAGALLAGNVDQSGGFDLTGADLTGAKFDGAQCIGCNFTNSHLDGVNFSRAYLPGAVFAGATVRDADLTDARLYCGDQSNSSCPMVSGPSPRWSWPLALGSGESYGPVPFAIANLNGVSLNDVAACPDGKDGSSAPAGCDSDLLPDPNNAPPIPTPCTAAALEACPTPTSTVFDASSLGSPLALVAATPPTWATTFKVGGYYVALDDGTVRHIGQGPAELVAGHHGQHCPNPTESCGDEGLATQALLGTPTGMAVGLNGALYLADPALHRVREIGPPAAQARTRGRAERGRPRRAAKPRHRATSMPRHRHAACPRARRSARTRAVSCRNRSSQHQKPERKKKKRISAAGRSRQIVTVAGSGHECTNASAACGDGGPATNASLSGPYGVWADPGGRLFIADGRSGIREVQPDGTITTVGAGDGSYDIRSVVGDTSGHLYATTIDPDYLLKLDLGTKKLTKVVGTGTSGYNGNTDSNGLLLPGTQVQINHPGGLSVGLDGDVIFADTGNDLVRAYVPSSGHVINLGGLVTDGTPQGGFNDDGHSAAQTELDHPADVTATRGALLVVADTHNQRIRQLGPNPVAQRRVGASRARPCSHRGTKRGVRRQHGQPVSQRSRRDRRTPTARRCRPSGQRRVMRSLLVTQR